MENINIRKFAHTDVEEFLRISRVSFAEETRAAGMSPEDFERETRRIFRWRMIPYKLLTALMGIKWEGYVAEVEGKVAGGGMYIGRKEQMAVTNLMVDPEYRRRGVGQALLIKRLERLSELEYPYVTAQVLDTNLASLGNLRKQGFSEYNRYSVYERRLSSDQGNMKGNDRFSIRTVNRRDRAVFNAIETRTTSPLVLQVNGSLDSRYFLSILHRSFLTYTGFSWWIRAVLVDGRIIGFLRADYQRCQNKGTLLLPVIEDTELGFLPQMVRVAEGWLAGAHRESVLVEVPEDRVRISEYLRESRWERTYTWIELIKWLDR